MPKLLCESKSYLRAVLDAMREEHVNAASVNGQSVEEGESGDGGGKEEGVGEDVGIVGGRFELLSWSRLGEIPLVTTSTGRGRAIPAV